MESGDGSGCKEFPSFLSSLCLRGFFTGEVLLSILNIQIVALDMMLLLTPPETIPKHGEAAGSGKSRGATTPPAHTTARRFCPWKQVSATTGQVSSRCGTKTAEPLLQSGLPFSTSAAPSQKFPGVLSGVGEDEGTGEDQT